MKDESQKIVAAGFSLRDPAQTKVCGYIIGNYKETI